MIFTSGWTLLLLTYIWWYRYQSIYHLIDEKWSIQQYIRSLGNTLGHIYKETVIQYYLNFNNRKQWHLILEKWYICICSFPTRGPVWRKFYSGRVWPSRTLSALLFWQYDFTSRSKTLASLLFPTSAPSIFQTVAKQRTLLLQQFSLPGQKLGCRHSAGSTLPKLASRVKVSH